MLSLLRSKRGNRSKHGFFGTTPLRRWQRVWPRFENLTSNGGSHHLARTPTLTSLRWSRKRLGVQRWQDGLIWGDAVPLWFSACHGRQPSVSRHAGGLFCAFPSLSCRPSSTLRPIQSLTSDRWRSSRPVDRCALVEVTCRKSCRNLERSRAFQYGPDEIRESELGNKAVVCEDRHPLTCGSLTTAASWFMKRPMARGNFTISETATKLRTFLRRGKKCGT